MGESTGGRDMQDKVLEVPRGWELVHSDADDFAIVMQDFCQHRWGTQVICVQNGADGFDSYRTALRTVGGAPGGPGTVFEADIDWLQPTDESGRRFRFRGLSGR